MRKLGGFGLAGVMTASLAAPACGDSGSGQAGGQTDASMDTGAATGGTGGTGAAGGTGGTGGTGGGAAGTAGAAATGGAAGTAGTAGSSGSAGAAGGAGAPTDAGVDASMDAGTTCSSGDYFNFATGSCETCAVSDGATMVLGCSQFRLGTTRYDPATQQITIDATDIVQIDRGTFTVDYLFFDEGGLEDVAEISGTVTVVGERLILDLAGQVPLGTPRGIRVTSLDLVDKCGDIQQHEPLVNFDDMDALLFEPPSSSGDAGSDAGDAGMDAIAPDGGAEWTVGCVFEGVI